MSKTPLQTMRLRLSLSSLSIFLTSTLIWCAASACQPLSNDLKDHRKGADASYDPKLTAGNSARDFLTDSNFRSLIVEIQAVAGHEPTQEAINRLQFFLEQRLYKPNGVKIVLGNSIPSNGRGKYHLSEIRNIEDRYRSKFSKKDQLAAYLLFVDGSSVDDQPGYQVMAQAYRNTSVVFYEKSVRQEAAKIPGLMNWLSETTLMQHEFGHLLGLVGGGISDQSHHEDPANRGHCLPNTKTPCLMHHAAESAMGWAAANGQPLELDAACLQDLKAAGGR